MALTIKQIEESLRNTGGFVSQAAKKLGVTQQAIAKRIKKSDRLQQLKRDIEESYLDLAESKVIKGINDGDRVLLQFYLKCKGKHRGYVERQELEHTGKDNGAIKHTITAESAIEEMKKRGLPIPKVD